MSVYELIVQAPSEDAVHDFVDELLEEEILSITPLKGDQRYVAVIDLDVGLYMQAVMEGVLNIALGWPDSPLITWSRRSH